MSEKKLKAERPFYELPAHIKPCSRIIQETRLQLSYRGSKGQQPPGSAGASSPRFSPGDSNFERGDWNHERFGGPVLGERDAQEGYFDVGGSPTGGGGGGGFPGIRAVHTQRPKTGTDHDIWGLSSRKRPPSAITLSRLSLSDFDEDQIMGSPSSPPGGMSRIASAGLGKPVPVRSTSLGGMSDLRTPPMTPLRSATLPEETTLTEESAYQASGSSSVWGGGNQIEEATERIRSLQTKDFGTDLEYTNDLGAQGHPKNQVEDEETSEGLSGAVNNLHSVMDNAVISDRPLKADLIATLQRVKSHISELDHCHPQIKHRLLKLIFKLVEQNQQDEDIVFWASFVLLHCKIMGNNLTTVFKMVFKASRSKEYWVIIQESEYLDVFMESFSQICPLTQTESMIYGYGTLKFICTEKYVLTRIIELNLISIMTLHLKLLNYELTKTKAQKETQKDGEEEECPNNNKRGKESSSKPSKPIPESIFNGVFQLTSILRSVVGEDSTLGTVVSSGLLEELCDSLRWTVEDIDILSNVVRILSVVSGDSLCCQVISANGSFAGSVVRTIQQWYAKDDVIVRLTYCLGNLLAQCESMRVKLFEQPRCYDVILHLITHYMDRLSPISEDIVIKTIRILANWSLNPVIGREISNDPQICQILSSIISSRDFSDELLICVISTLNNTTFYKDYSMTDENTVQTTEYLCEFLTWKNLEGRTEVMKVLGNLTRNHIIREVASEHVQELLLSLEEEDENQELLCATVGVLMNIIVDSRASEEFLRNQGIDHLLTLMRVKQDLALNLMVCQFLWNIQISSENDHFDGDEEVEEEEGKEEMGCDGGDPPRPTNHTKDAIINRKQKLEIQQLIRQKLDSLNHISASNSSRVSLNELQFLEMEPEFRAVAQRLVEKLGE